jgi:uncharacterized protein YgiM (DUF1202 family)
MRTRACWHAEDKGICIMRHKLRKAASAAVVAAAAMAAAPALALDDDNFDDVAVIIGNKNYANDVAPVEFAHNDAEAMKRFVIDVLKFSPENVIVLKDATKNELETHFSKGGILEDWIDPNGNSDVIVFYSGHGVPGLQDSNSYLLPVDGNANKAELSGYPLSEFYANLKALKAKSVTVYLDACFSGDSGGGVLFRNASPVFQAAKKTVAPAELTVVSASQADQIASWDIEAKHGLFTQHLLNALYGGADGENYGNGDGQVTLGEVGSYLKRNMSRAAKRSFGRRQDAALSGKDETVVASYQPGQLPQRPQLVAADGKPADKPQVASLPKDDGGATGLEPLDEAYVTIKTSNVRSQPSVKGDKVATLDVGTKVTALGKVKGEDWYLIAVDGREIGYIFASLIMPEAEGLAMLQRQRQQTSTTSRPSSVAATPTGAPPARVAGITRVYLQGVTNNNGADMAFLTDVVRGVVGSSPSTQLLGASNMNDADVVISGRVTRVDKQTVQNPDAVGAAMVRGLLGNLGQAVTQNVTQTLDVYRVEVMLSALDRHTGRTTMERGYHEEQTAAGTPSGQVVGSAMQVAASRAAESLMMRMSGGVPAQRPTAQQQPQQQQQNNSGGGLLNNLFNTR